MPKPWGRVARAEMDVRPGGIVSIDIATGDGRVDAWPELVRLRVERVRAQRTLRVHQAKQ